jgi:hypothetical protein
MPQEQDPHHPSLEATQAAHYLATITAHFLEFGLLWEKTPADLVYELDYHNAWHKYEVDQERKRGEHTAAYHEVRLVDLQALAQANVRARAERGEHDSDAYRVARYVEQLIAAALSEERAIEQGTDTALAVTEEDVPF